MFGFFAYVIQGPHQERRINKNVGNGNVSVLLNFEFKCQERV